MIAEGNWADRLTVSLGDRRVIPPMPPGRQAMVPDTERERKKARLPDQSASWSAFISYTSATGERTERLITIRRISTLYDWPETVNAYCHLRKAYRMFRVDRISEMICVETGEALDPTEQLRALHRSGALTVEDKRLTKLVVMLTFMARCDGFEHPREALAIEAILARYTRFFGGDDATLQKSLTESRRLAPSAEDMVRAVRGMIRGRAAGNLCRFALNACGEIIEADGIQHDSELQWALEVREILHTVATR